MCATLVNFTVSKIQLLKIMTCLKSSLHETRKLVLVDPKFTFCLVFIYTCIYYVYMYQ